MAKERDHDIRIEPFEHAAGGWTSVRTVAHALTEAHIPVRGTRVLLKQNKPDGFSCVSCAWAKPAHPHPAEFCEHGAKATAWELTTARCTPGFFAQHTVTELEGWSDHDLEFQGRLTAPMRWDEATDKYVEARWEDAFADIGARLRRVDPKAAVFYASGRASLETSYMYQLMARLYGTNNLPDSSNMCHESTSVGLPKSIGVPVGTVRLEDFDHCDGIFVIGHNVGTNSPRMLHSLEDARKRGVPLITFNPLKEPGLVRFANPQSPLEMLTPKDIEVSTQYHQIRAGGDLGALSGLCKVLVEWDDEARLQERAGPLDHDFITEHTHGFAAFADQLRQLGWDEIERASGLTRTAIESAARVLGGCKRLIGIYGMGMTQHREGVLNVQMVANLLLLGGHFGREGAGILPVRGHSNVQGQRTVGITEKPELAPLDKLRALYGFEPPREKGLTTVEACEGMLDGSVQAVISLGGNLMRAVPDTLRIEPAWRRLPLSVQIVTRLNRSAVLHGRTAWLLPCLGRIEIDRQGDGVPQAVSTEDSTGAMHGSKGQAEPASARLLSEPAIVAGIAKALLAPNPLVPWDAWVADYAKVRAEIAKAYPDIFHDFEARMWQPGGFHRPSPPRERQWKTETGKANFIVAASLDEDPDMRFAGTGILRLTTVRSFDQFNTTVYGNHDTFRGIHGTRQVLLMNRADIARLGLRDGMLVRATTAADDYPRAVSGLRVVPFDVPPGCVAGYYPELNALVPLWHHAKGSRVPGYKSIPVRIEAT